MISRRLIVGYIFFLTLTIGIGYIGGIQTIPPFLLSLIIYSCIAYILHLVFAHFRGKRKEKYTHFFIIFLYKVSIYTSILLILIGYFIVHQTHLFPAKMPSYTLTNGEKTIIFQSMSHIASPKFYGEVRKNIWTAKQRGYVLYYEGVGSGSDENKKAFDKALGIKLEAESYHMLATLYGVTAQDNNSLLNIVNNKDYNVDLNLDEIMKIYNQKIKNIPQNETTSKKEKITGKVYDIENDILAKLAGLNEKQLFLLRYFNQAIMNFMIKHEGFREKVLILSGKQDIFSVILEDRNKHLAKEILQSDDKKIIITYGLMHFSGVLELLKKIDQNWAITKTEYQQVIYPAGKSSS